MPQGTLFLFAKFPTPGNVKTRLIPLLGAEGAALLAEAMLRDLIARIEKWQPPFPVKRVLCFSPLASESSFKNWIPEVTSDSTWSLQPQSDGDLGARLKHAFERITPAAMHATAFIGMDCIDLPTDAITHALQMCHQGRAAIRPASDGGYVMLSLPSQAPSKVFDNVNWSTEKTCASQITQAQALGLSMEKIGQSEDVDQPEDLSRLWQRIKGHPEEFPRTCRILEKRFNK